ncbi:MAG: hypothetical protein ACJAZ1_001793 [Yoonia sp.]|jgi:hypothetical protein
MWLIISLTSLAISTSIWAISQTMRVATLSNAVATQAVQNRRQIARLAAKARLRRIVAAVPLAGIAAAGYFEERDRREWLEANPGKTNPDYACEVAELTTEVMDEVLAGMPMDIQLPEWAVPECETAPT